MLINVHQRKRVVPWGVAGGAAGGVAGGVAGGGPRDAPWDIKTGGGGSGQLPIFEKLSTFAITPSVHE